MWKQGFKSVGWQLEGFMKSLCRTGQAIGFWRRQLHDLEIEQAGSNYRHSLVLNLPVISISGRHLRLLDTAKVRKATFDLVEHPESTVIALHRISSHFAH